jgi:hypothetical protein
MKTGADPTLKKKSAFGDVWETEQLSLAFQFGSVWEPSEEV